MISAVSFTITVAGFTVGAGTTSAAGMPELLLLVPALVLVLVVQYGLEVHYSPGVPSLVCVTINLFVSLTSLTILDKILHSQDLQKHIGFPSKNTTQRNLNCNSMIVLGT